MDYKTCCDCGIGYNWTDIENHVKAPVEQLITFLNENGLGALAGEVTKAYIVKCSCGREFVAALLDMGMDVESWVIVKISVEGSNKYVN